MKVRSSERIGTDLEHEKGNDGGRLSGNVFWEVKRAEDGWCVHERWEECEDGEDVDLRDEEKLCRVHVIPVPEFMGKDGFDLFWLALLNEGIEDHNMLALEE